MEIDILIQQLAEGPTVLLRDDLLRGGEVGLREEEAAEPDPREARVDALEAADNFNVFNILKFNNFSFFNENVLTFSSKMLKRENVVQIQGDFNIFNIF